MIPKENIETYNKYRDESNKYLLCHAPFTSINFEQSGNMTACCFNRSDSLGEYPKQSIKQAWHSNATKKLRKATEKAKLSKGCFLCTKTIKNEEYLSTRALLYDQFALNSKKIKVENILNKFHLKSILYPKVFEFELSSKCNLECEMCNGYFSSSIRANRDKLPPLDSPYDDKFVDQVNEFLPYLSDAKFLGGEPFLIDIYYKIWDKIIETNPKIYTHITTNGTILNARIKDVLNKLKVGITVSIDAYDKEVYESIRKNAFHKRVMENILYFDKLTKEKGTYMCLAVCPMKHNWEQMPKLVSFANKLNINIYFNNMWYPKNLSILNLDSKRKLDIIENWKQAQTKLKLETPSHKNNAKVFNGLINQIEQSLKKEEKTKPINKPLIIDSYTIEERIKIYLKNDGCQNELIKILEENTRLFVSIFFKTIEENCSDDKKNEVTIKVASVIEKYKKLDSRYIKQNMVEAIHHGLNYAIGFFEKNDLEAIIESMRIGNSSNTLK